MRHLIGDDPFVCIQLFQMPEIGFADRFKNLALKMNIRMLG